MSDTDPPESIPPPGPADPRDSPGDPSAAVARARVMMRLLGEDDDGPPKIGRFTLLERVAEGGMGVVFAAYDPDLDRKIAVKLLRSADADASLRRRVVREAQAMARLSHPNVAQIYEVSEHRGSTCIAMEFVRGETLRVWQQADRSWQEILAIYVQAGRGLAAAHAAGLVHRDFKPDNAIVGRDGRVRVLDFGLARNDAVATTSENETQTVLPAPHHDALGTPLTHAGALMGTPAYMAPEQFLGEEVTAKADQFALCVALWEGLHGERPFAGTTRADLIANVTRGRVRAVPKGSRVPEWVRAVLLRGLAVGPMDRFASTDVLLAALEDDPSRRRRRTLAVGATVLTIAGVAAGIVGVRRYQRNETIAGCEASGAAIDEVWNDEARTRVREGLLATGVNYAATTAEKVMPWLDHAASTWREQSTHACMNAEVDHSWEADMLERARWCLEGRRLEISALVTELARADVHVAHKAVVAAGGLAKGASCVAPTILSSLPPPPDENARDEIMQVRAELARAWTMVEAGKYAEGLDIAKAARERSQVLAWPPLVAAAYHREGTLLDESGAYAEAERAFETAYVEAAKANAWDVAAEAATKLIATVGADQSRHAEGRGWATHAGIAGSHAGDPDALAESSRTNNLGLVAFDAGDYREAQHLFEQSLEIDERVLGPGHPEVAFSLANLSVLHDAIGSTARARALIDRAVAILEASLGPDHPDLAASLDHLADLHQKAGDYEQARGLYERGLAIRQNALGADHPDVAFSLHNLADLLKTTGDIPEALRLERRAVAILEAKLGPEHPDVATGLGTLAGIHGLTGDHATARALFERALAISEKRLGPEHPEVATALHNLGSAHQAVGDHERARAVRERALAIFEKALGPEHPTLVYVLSGLASVALAQSRPDGAVTLAERALVIGERGSVPAAVLAEVRFTLARGLWGAPNDRGRDRVRAIALATMARDALRDVPGSGAMLADVEAWLSEHVPAD